MNVQVMENLNAVSILIDSLPFLKAVIAVIAASMLTDSFCNVVKLFKKEV